MPGLDVRVSVFCQRRRTQRRSFITRLYRVYIRASVRRERTTPSRVCTRFSISVFFLIPPPHTLLRMSAPDTGSHLGVASVKSRVKSLTRNQRENPPISDARQETRRILCYSARPCNIKPPLPRSEKFFAPALAPPHPPGPLLIHPFAFKGDTLSKKTKRTKVCNRSTERPLLFFFFSEKNPSLGVGGLRGGVGTATMMRWKGRSGTIK